MLKVTVYDLAIFAGRAEISALLVGVPWLWFRVSRTENIGSRKILQVHQRLAIAK